MSLDTEWINSLCQQPSAQPRNVIKDVVGSASSERDPFASFIAGPFPNRPIPLLQQLASFLSRNQSPLLQEKPLDWNVLLLCASSLWSMGPKWAVYQSVSRLPGGHFLRGTIHIMAAAPTSFYEGPTGSMQQDELNSKGHFIKPNESGTCSAWAAVTHLSVFSSQVERRPEAAVSGMRVCAVLQQRRHHLSVAAGTGHVELQQQREKLRQSQDSRKDNLLKAL